MMIGREEHNDLCIGIDLGTTNSVVATVNVKTNGDIVSKVVDIPRAVDVYSVASEQARLSTQKKPTLPSCIYYREEKNYEPLVGDFAKVQYPLRPHLVAKSIKSQMGRPQTEGLSPDVPDKTPAQVSAQILRHLKNQTEKIYRCKIDDAVITVPANFDSAMCRATRDAAELAGIKVRNADGSERPILLPEPNAVIYDLINQVHNGEISSHIIDFSSPRSVLVFDIGGGTLDITLLRIARREDCQEVLQVEEIATNRYTLLGGDDFDERIAETMYQRYLKQYASYPEVVRKLKQEKTTVMPQLRNYAEQLKLDLSEHCSNEYAADSGWDSGWDDEEEEVTFPVGGSILGMGFAYDDVFTKEEIEKILDVFMGKDLKYSDHRRIGQILAAGNTGNIIFPILDVLHKAAEKLGTEDVSVNEVVVNGGMSKFYMITDRLKEFFGLEPIVALDPDQAVARGAAVYHHYLHKYEAIRDDMRIVGSAAAPAIEWGRNILNDSLYLGVKNGAVHMLIPTGAELPYQSELQTGFRLMPGQNQIAVPIKSRNLDGTYRTISSGNICFRNKYPDGVYVSFVVSMSSSKVITMKAWTSSDEAGNHRLEEGTVMIVIDSGERKGAKTKIVAPRGSILNPKDEISSLHQLCKNLEKWKNDSVLSKKASSAVASICGAGNPEDFADVILDTLEQTASNNMKLRLFVIARKIGQCWSDAKKRRLEKLCMAQIHIHLSGLGMCPKARIPADVQAVYTLSICGSEAQMKRLVPLHENGKFVQACLYAHAKTGTELDWIYQKFAEDKKLAAKHQANTLQFSAYSLGLVFHNGMAGIYEPLREEILKELGEIIAAASLNGAPLVSCLLAAGWVGDQRGGENSISQGVLTEVVTVLEIMDELYEEAVVKYCERARGVTWKMLTGASLSEEEEEFLLTKLEL